MLSLFDYEKNTAHFAILWVFNKAGKVGLVEYKKKLTHRTREMRNDVV